ncbi:MAG TPA: hypothetical protein VFT99_24845, partial [Roseiflexaceae bacterium]|nr:hypothetical protein [Roseiflexaceae bacterium]
ASGQLTVAAALARTARPVVARDTDAIAALLAYLPSADAVATIGLYGLLLAWQKAGRNALPAALRQFQTARAGATQAVTRLQQAASQLEGQPDAQLPEILEALARAEAERSDRAAERCGRRAAALLDASDRLAAHWSGGPALDWMLRDAAQVLGHTPALVDLAAPGDAAATLFVCGAESVALDGSALLTESAARQLAAAQRLGLPRYLIAPAGPDTGITTHTEAGHAGVRRVAPRDISAVVTDRGLYRPEMVARYVNDADLPFGVIPLN